MSRRLEAQVQEVPEQVVLVRKVLQYLKRSINKLSLFIHHDNDLERFFQASYQELSDCIDQFGTLSVEVKPFELYCLGHSVFQDDEGKENSIPYKLFRAGIRTLSFKQELSINGLTQFGKILNKNPMDLQEEELSSLLWNANIEGLLYLQVQLIEEKDIEESDASFDKLEPADFQSALLHVGDLISSENEEGGVHLRSFSSNDLLFDEKLADIDIIKVFSCGEIKDSFEMTPEAICLMNDHEEIDLSARGCDLLFFAIHQLQTLEELELIKDSIYMLCEHLFLSHDFSRLAFLLDSLDSIENEGCTELFDGLKEVSLRLFELFGVPERLEIILSFFEKNLDMSQDTEADIRILLELVGSNMHEKLKSSIGRYSARVRLFLIDFVLQDTKSRHAIFDELLLEYEHRRDVVLELLSAASDFGDILDYKHWKQLLATDDFMLKRKVLEAIAKHHSSNLPRLATGLLSSEEPAFCTFLFELLGHSGRFGVRVGIQFLESPSFRRFSWKEQLELYARFAQGENDHVFSWFGTVLREKSRLFAPSVDKKKRLVIHGLEVFSTKEARCLIEANSKAQNHSRNIHQELRLSLKRLSR